MPEKAPQASPSEIVSKIVKHPKQPPDTLLLTGFISPSSEEATTRLYLDPQLSNYVEIPNGAILHTQDIPAGQSPIGG
ncbi:MAG: hypothetical protein KGM47_07735 [Acidobacteriota bacterium]|nr:hypothetical protein [Acidobacteriota bacterium]